MADWFVCFQKCRDNLELHIAPPSAPHCSTLSSTLLHLQLHIAPPSAPHCSFPRKKLYIFRPYSPFRWLILKIFFDKTLPPANLQGSIFDKAKQCRIFLDKSLKISVGFHCFILSLYGLFFNDPLSHLEKKNNSPVTQRYKKQRL